MLGVALLGGGLPSAIFAAELTFSTFWRHGWWLYLQPECAVVLFMLGTTADVALGFLLSSLVQARTPVCRPTPKGLVLTRFSLDFGTGTYVDATRVRRGAVLYRHVTAPRNRIIKWFSYR